MNTTEKIILRENKTLKLNNVLIREISKNEFTDVNKIAHMMESYIKTKANSIVGPMINYSSISTDESGQPKIILKLMMQIKNPIHNIESPYEYKSQIKISNCLFARFLDKEENIQFAYSKLNLYAFENDINLKGDSYTVLVDNKEGKMVADVFMEVQKEGLALENL